jgi:hypothetical protein
MAPTSGLGMWRYLLFDFPYYRLESIMMDVGYDQCPDFAVTWYVNTLPIESPCLICGSSLPYDSCTGD